MTSSHPCKIAGSTRMIGIMSFSGTAGELVEMMKPYAGPEKIPPPLWNPLAMVVLPGDDRVLTHRYRHLRFVE